MVTPLLGLLYKLLTVLARGEKRSTAAEMVMAMTAHPLHAFLHRKHRPPSYEGDTSKEFVPEHPGPSGDRPWNPPETKASQG